MNARSIQSHGLWCDECVGAHEWHQLRWVADENAGTWTWLCPNREAILRVDPYAPAADTPFTNSQPRSQGSKTETEGVGIPDRGVQGQEGGLSVAIR